MDAWSSTRTALYSICVLYRHRYPLYMIEQIPYRLFMSLMSSMSIICLKGWLSFVIAYGCVAWGRNRLMFSTCLFISDIDTPCT